MNFLFSFSNYSFHSSLHSTFSYSALQVRESTGTVTKECFHVKMRRKNACLSTSVQPLILLVKKACCGQIDICPDLLNKFSHLSQKEGGWQKNAKKQKGVEFILICIFLTGQHFFHPGPRTSTKFMR